MGASARAWHVISSGRCIACCGRTEGGGAGVTGVGRREGDEARPCSLVVDGRRVREDRRHVGGRARVVAACVCARGSERGEDGRWLGTWVVRDWDKLREVVCRALGVSGRGGDRAEAADRWWAETREGRGEQGAGAGGQPSRTRAYGDGRRGQAARQQRICRLR